MTNDKPVDDESIYMEDKVPSAEEHYTLRKAAGLTPPPRPENEEALQRGYFGVTLRDKSKNDQAIGMGRILGDGMFLFVTDMAILPEYQRRGLGGKILDRLVTYVEEKEPRARLALEADPPGVKLYEKRGFVKQPHRLAMIRSTYWSADGVIKEEK